MRRKNIFLIAFISISCIIAGLLLWRYYKDGKTAAQKHVVLIGKKIEHSTYKNGTLSFLANSAKYRVWYVLTDKALENNNTDVVAVEDIMDKEKVTDGIKRLGKKGLPLDKISYMLTLSKTKKAFALQKELHKEFNVNKGWTQDAMEGILRQYQEKRTHGQNEVHLVLQGGEQIAAKAMAYTAYQRKALNPHQQDPSTLYESYVALDNTAKVNALIDSAMQFAKEKQYKDGGLTVYFDAQDKIKGVQPFSRLFPKLGYRNIFETYKPSPQAPYQARIYCSIQSNCDSEQKDMFQLEPQHIQKQCGSSLKSISILQDNETTNIALDSVSSVSVGAQVVLHLEDKSRATLEKNIEAIKTVPLISCWQVKTA